ncbi:FadR/GntR family transcriptional regulator [Arthrobacter sp. MDT1-48-3]
MTQTSGAVQPAVQASGTPGIAPAGGLNLVAPRSRADHLAAALEERIRAQSLEPGTLVGTLPSLREETGYARATVSAAVRLLRERGVLEIRPGRAGGLFVAETSPVVRLRHTLLTVGEQPSAVIDAIELREHLEELIDVGAARCRSNEDISELRLLVANMESSADWNGFMRANWALHERIAAICPNAMARAVYIGTLGHLSSASSRFDEDEAAAAAYRADRLRVHAELVEAIANGDIATVRQAVINHNH